MEKPILDYEFTEQEVPYGGVVGNKMVINEKELITEYLKKEGYNYILVNDTRFRKLMANTINFRLFKLQQAIIRLIGRVLERFGIK